MNLICSLDVSSYFLLCPWVLLIKFFLVNRLVVLLYFGHHPCRENRKSHTAFQIPATPRFHPETLLDWFQWQTMPLGRSAGNTQTSVAQTARELPAADIMEKEKSYTFIYIKGCIAYCYLSDTTNAVRKGKEGTLWISDQNRAMAGCRAAGGVQTKQTQYISTLSPSNYASVLKTNDRQLWPRNSNLTKIHHN